MSDTLIDAIECMKLTPALLTPSQIDLMAKADKELGRRARSAHQSAAMAEAVTLAIKAAIAHPNARIDALESRVLELEAELAAAKMGAEPR